MERGAAADSPTREPLPSTANLDGIVLALGPVAAAVRMADEWDAAFGGEVTLVRVRERSALTALGVELGGIRFAEAGNGRLWLDLLAGSNRLGGVTVGASVGLALEVGDVQLPAPGWQATVWTFAGVLPYVRVGEIESDGLFVDAGVKIALPAIRW